MPPMSLKPEDQIDDDPRTLLGLIALGEKPSDFGPDGDKKEPPNRVVRVLEGIDRAITELAELRKVGLKSRAHLYATKLGLLLLWDTPEWPELRKRFNAFSRKVKAKTRDRSTIAFLEARTGFPWAHPSKIRMKTFLHPWVAQGIDNSAEVLGVPKSQAVVVCLVLALSTLPEWEGFFAEDMARLNTHLVRRFRVLDVI